MAAPLSLAEETRRYVRVALNRGPKPYQTVIDLGGKLGLAGCYIRGAFDFLGGVVSRGSTGEAWWGLPLDEPIDECEAGC